MNSFSFCSAGTLISIEHKTPGDPRKPHPQDPRSPEAGSLCPISEPSSQALAVAGAVPRAGSLGVFWLIISMTACFTACFSCRTRWGFSIWLVRKPVFLSKKPLASSAVCSPSMSTCSASCSFLGTHVELVGGASHSYLSCLCWTRSDSPGLPHGWSVPP